MKGKTEAAGWPVDLIPAEEGGFIVTFPDMPNGWSQGEDGAEALVQAEDLIEEIVLGRMAYGEDVPLPSAENDESFQGPSTTCHNGFVA